MVCLEHISHISTAVSAYQLMVGGRVRIKLSPDAKKIILEDGSTLHEFLSEKDLAIWLYESIAQKAQIEAKWIKSIK